MGFQHIQDLNTKMKTKLNTKQKPIYGDIKILDLDGNILFMCLPKKANWYLSRNLANIITNDPLVIQLNFKPKGSGQNGYILSGKHNRCVICGCKDELTRHHIVPYTYRKHFPEIVKSHNSYDVLPICSAHHSEYEENYAIELKHVFAEKYDAPFDLEINIDLTIVVKYSTLLLDHWNKLPYHRKKHMIKTIRNYHGYVGRLKNVILIYAYADLSKTKTEIHGKKIIEKLTLENKLQWFVETWREHFVTSMNPQYMPKHWTVKRPI